MEKKLQDYIQYYIGCKCTNEWFPEGHNMHSYNWELKGIKYDGSVRPYLLVNEEQDEFTWTDSIKPILRKLDSMDDADIKSFLNWNRLNELYVDVSYKREELAITLNYSIPCGGDMVYPQSVTIMPKIELRSDQFDHLIKNGFDLFDLIESGLAIDASTLTK